MIWLPDQQATEQAAFQLAGFLRAPIRIAFRGDMGVGKTTFVRALLRALGWKLSVKSPTFTWVETYELAQGVLHHFDLYRINSDHEFLSLGYTDYLTADAICCIEWPERAERFIGAVDLSISLHIEAQGRLMTLCAGTEAGHLIMKQWVAHHAVSEALCQQ